MKRENFESIVDYTTVLSNFEGPLDLLLYLINREEIEIKDIFVSQVTEQFLQYMQGLSSLDVEKVADYLNIAATIIKIKAQSLVPNVTEDPETDEEIEDEKRELIRALEEFRLIKEESKKLKELETIGHYFKAPDKDAGTPRRVFSLENLTLDGLVSAFSTLMMRKSARFPATGSPSAKRSPTFWRAWREGRRPASNSSFPQTVQNPRSLRPFRRSSSF